ncbi:hypothetical protein C0J52_00972 [Blattella germanica]|nr:hypothetical protein C0J52_00972 [Blattella germanica]
MRNEEMEKETYRLPANILTTFVKTKNNFISLSKMFNVSHILTELRHQEHAKNLQRSLGNYVSLECRDGTAEHTMRLLLASENGGKGTTSYFIGNFIKLNRTNKIILREVISSFYCFSTELTVYLRKYSDVMREVCFETDGIGASH